MHDARLLGTWKSDKTRTLREHTFKPSVPDKSKKRLEALFGKMTVRYTRTRVYMDLNGIESWARYKVLAKDRTSVAIWLSDGGSRDEGYLSMIRALREIAPDELAGTISHIHFDGNHYWINVAANFAEYFRRVPSPKRKHTK